jgi:hypothetical protein
MGAPLHRADGSATYSANGYTVVGAINGPLEVQRRDELAEEAAVEVNIRPAIGVGSLSTSYIKPRPVLNLQQARKNDKSRLLSNRLSNA